MKKLITSLLIAINFTVSFSSYGSDSQDTGLGQHIDPLLIHSYSGSNLLPLPYLPTREEKEPKSKKRKREEEAQRFTEERPSKRICLTPGEQQPTSSTTSSSSSSSTNREHAVDKSPLEELPTELFEHMWQLIPPQHRGNLALASQDLAVKSRYSRGHSQAAVTHLTIPVTDITLENLKDADNKFPKVTSLTITRAPEEAGIKPEQLTLLATNFPKITSLNLSNTGLSVEGIKALAQPDIFTSLKRLDISDNQQLGDTSIDILANAPFASTLEFLNLANNNLKEAGIRALSQPGIFTSLKALDLSDNKQIGNAGFRALANAPFAPTLESLNLADNNLKEVGIHFLVPPEGIFTSLKALNLSGNLLLGTGTVIIVMAPFIHQLEELNLAGTNTSDLALSIFTQAPLTSLRTLDISGNPLISDMSVDRLLAAPFAGRLESLNLHNTAITIEAQGRLREAQIAQNIIL